MGHLAHQVKRFLGGQVGLGSSSGKRSINTEDAEEFAEERKGFPPRPLRNPLRPLPLKIYFQEIQVGRYRTPD
ncbi:MAG: hypothetical protein QOG23_1665 [Blastocatellia bacterium]|jgi:hypothetical protein|nr:hypothetical protein [Blastocatellia bacterium]